MAVPWPTFINTVGSYLNDSSEGKSLEQTAEKIALEYHKVVVSAGTILHANPVLVQAPYVPIKLAIQKSLEDIFNSGETPQLIHFLDWANATSDYWLTTTMSPSPYHPLNMIASTGTSGIPVPITHTIINGGVIPTLQADLLLAFAQPPAPIPAGIPTATKLAKAFTTHLSTVDGLQIELVTAGTPTTPTLALPSPSGSWFGLV
tara:strand:- start:29 stop:640 length:612 start_codon:yes stop_codon:yes gene_type:complete